MSRGNGYQDPAKESGLPREEQPPSVKEQPVRDLTEREAGKECPDFTLLPPSHFSRLLVTKFN